MLLSSRRGEKENRPPVRCGCLYYYATSISLEREKRGAEVASVDRIDRKSEREREKENVVDDGEVERGKAKSETGVKERERVVET